jgi:DNA mismatch repair protein MutS
MGDFYEMFGEDARIASKVLGITLTSRSKSKQPPPEEMMCGVPYQHYQRYALKLLKAGYNVAICDQLEDAAAAKGIVKRGVTRVISQGTVIDSEEVDGVENNFLMAIYYKESYYISAADVSTGEIYLLKVSEDNLGAVLTQYSPTEIVSNTPLGINQKHILREPRKDAVVRVLEKYGLKDNKELGVSDKEMLIPLDMVISFVGERLLEISFQRPKVINNEDKLIIDEATARALELFPMHSLPEGSLTLYAVLNFTQTPMGARALLMRVKNPVRNAEIINWRLDTVEFFVNERRIADLLREILSNVNDIERIINRTASRRTNPRELITLKNSLVNLPRAMEILKNTENANIRRLADSFMLAERIASLISRAIIDDPNIALSEGGIIKTGYNAEVDKLRRVVSDAGDLFAGIETKLKTQTGINQIKVSFNRVFGYYIEVPKGSLKKVPEYFERRQTMVNAERFVTEEIKELEGTVLGAEEKLNGIEYELFCNVRNVIAQDIGALRELSQSVAELDLYLSLATAAQKRGYARPVVDDGCLIELREARHPTVEVISKDGYVVNDILLDYEQNRLALITGPNMSG